MPDNYDRIFESMDFSKVKDHPNILIAARFWEKERYEAAHTCYKYLREIDDLIDCHKAMHSVIDENEKQSFRNKVQFWLDSIRNKNNSNAAIKHELVKTMTKFHIPVWPMEDFARSMIHDIDHNGFSSLDDFVIYSQGASVAPASIFVHLCGLRSRGEEYLPPSFDVKEAATPCAMFSYIVHVIRDFQTDQENNLNYFALETLARHNLNPDKIREVAFGSKITQDFRNMIREYYMLADEYREKTYRMLDKISFYVAPRYMLSLQIIFNLYLMVFEKIDYSRGSFTSAELNPTTEEIKKRVLKTLSDFRSR